MRNLITLVFLVLPYVTFGQSLSRISEVTCEEIQKKREYKKVLGKGVLLHISCVDSTHFFFLLKEKADSSGILLNSSYEVKGKNLKVTSTGPDFFVVKRKSAPTKYQYTFKTKSWRFDKAVPPSWSTGNREDP